MHDEIVAVAGRGVESRQSCGTRAEIHRLHCMGARRCLQGEHSRACAQVEHPRPVGNRHRLGEEQRVATRRVDGVTLRQGTAGARERIEATVRPHDTVADRLAAQRGEEGPALSAQQIAALRLSE